jgi:hypothetical protein
MRVRAWTAAAVSGLVVITGACASSPSGGGAATTTPSIPAPPGVDQQALPPGTLDDASTGQVANCTYAAAQTFTAGRTGSLFEVSFADGQSGNFAAHVSVQPLDTAGHPSGDVLGSGSLSATGSISGPAWFDVHLSTAAPITAGTHYALVFTPANCATDPSLLVMARYDTDLYPGGQAWTEEPGWVTESSWLGSSVAAGLDFYFKTWVG